jgi:hypothetical protein
MAARDGLDAVNKKIFPLLGIEADSAVHTDFVLYGSGAWYLDVTEKFRLRGKFLRARRSEEYPEQ